jgi:hypothetical protein
LEDGQEVWTASADLFYDVGGACKVEATAASAANDGVEADYFANVIVEGHCDRSVWWAVIDVA